MLRPGRHQQAEAIVNSLRSKAAKQPGPALKKTKKAIRKQAKSHSSPENHSESSFRIARHKNGTQSRVFIKILQTPPHTPMTKVEGHTVAATIKNVISRLLKPRLVTENTLTELRISEGKIYLESPADHSQSENCQPQKNNSTSSMCTDFSSALDKSILERIKNRFKIEYLY